MAQILATLEPEELPLLSTKLVTRMVLAALAIILLTVVLCVCGRFFGNVIALGGNSDDVRPVSVTIGHDTLRLGANTIRFASQRQDGVTQRLDLALAWPDMQGYTKLSRQKFDDVKQSANLIFVQITQATMSRDMSGRLEPIYMHLFRGPSTPFVAGLVRHDLKKEAGYENEALLTAARVGQPDYAVRCILPTDPARSTSGDCQRDIKIGHDLSVLYRFSSIRLNEWREIDKAVQAFVSSRLAPSPDDKRPPHDERND